MKHLKEVSKWGMCGDGVRHMRRILRENEAGNIRAIAVVALTRDGDVLRGMEWKQGELFSLIGTVSNCLHDLNKEITTKG